MYVHSLPEARSAASLYFRMMVLVALLPALLISCSSSTDPEVEQPVAFALSSVTLVDATKIRVDFTRAADAATAEDKVNYILIDVSPPPVQANGSASTIVVSRADLQPGGTVVMLTTATLDPSRSYELTLDGITSAVGGESVTATRVVDDAIMSGTITTWAGTGRAAYDGDGNPIEDSWFYLPADLEFTSTGCYISDWNNHNIRRVTPSNTLETVIGTNFVGDGPPPGEPDDLDPPGPPGIEINLNHPTDIDELPDGRILLTAWHNHKLRIYDPNTKLCYVSAGNLAGFSGDGGQAKDAEFSQPSQSVVQSDGTIYILDQRNQRIRKIDPSGVVTTVAGTGTQGFSGDGGPPINAELHFEAGANPQTSGALCFDATGRLYISDTANHRIRRIDFNANTITTVAGDGSASYSGDGGAAVSAALNNPRDIEIGPGGKLYICDEFNHRIRMVDLTSGVITTVAGNGSAGFSGDGGPATAAQLNRPHGLAFDANGYMYIADAHNHRIRRVTP